MIFAEKSAAITIETTLTPCTEISARSVSLSDAGFYKELPSFGDGSKPHYTIYFEGMDIQLPAILLGSPGDSMGFNPQPFECHHFKTWCESHVIRKHQDVCCFLCLDILPRTAIEIPQPTASTFLGGWLGLKTWIQPRNGLIRSNMAHLCPRCTDFKSLLVSMIGFENEQCGMGLIIFHPHPTISITFHNYHYWWANLQHVSILHSQPWDCSTDGGARWVEGSRQVIPVGVGRQKRLWDAVGHSGISPDPENRTCLRIHHPYPLSVPPTTISGASLLQ